MRLSCNFLNVYTIVYRVGLQYTRRVHVYTRASLTDKKGGSGLGLKDKSWS